MLLSCQELHCVWSSASVTHEDVPRSCADEHDVSSLEGVCLQEYVSTIPWPLRLLEIKEQLMDQTRWHCSVVFPYNQLKICQIFSKANIYSLLSFSHIILLLTALLVCVFRVSPTWPLSSVPLQSSISTAPINCNPAAISCNMHRSWPSHNYMESHLEKV